MSLEAIKYRPGHLEILNQLLLPHQLVYENVENTQDGWKAIREMKANFKICNNKLFYLYWIALSVLNCSS